MNNYNRGFSYGHNYTARNNTNSFSQDGPGAKRRKYRPGKKNQATPNIESLFKEPIAPPPIRSPSVSPRQGGGGTAFRLRTAYADYASQNYLEPAWYWDNYNKSCQSWQEKHQLAYYRSRCLALEFENQMLFEQISSLVEENTIFAEERGEMPSMRLAALGNPRDEVTAGKPQAGNKPTTTKNQEKIRKQEAAANKSEGDVEMNGVKTEGRKQTAAELQQEMDQLYGKDSAQISKLETSLQLKFNRFCDTHKPEVWMAIPLNPVTVAIE